MRHEALVNENWSVGVLFAAKACFQVITNLYIGPLTNKIGYTIPMFAGFIIIFCSSLRECAESAFLFPHLLRSVRIRGVVFCFIYCESAARCRLVLHIRFRNGHVSAEISR